MERRIQLAEEKSSSKRDSEADELRRELEEARMAERMVKMQLEETRGPLSPPLPPSTAATNSTHTYRGIAVSPWTANRHRVGLVFLVSGFTSNSRNTDSTFLVT